MFFLVIAPFYIPSYSAQMFSFPTSLLTLIFCFLILAIIMDVEYQTTRPVSWQTCMQVKKQVRIKDGRGDCFKTGKGAWHGCVLSGNNGLIIWDKGINFLGTSQLVLEVKELPANAWETQVQSLGQKDPLEEALATHSSILTWRIPETEEPCRLWCVGS